MAMTARNNLLEAGHLVPEAGGKNAARTIGKFRQKRRLPQRPARDAAAGFDPGTKKRIDHRAATPNA